MRLSKLEIQGFKSFAKKTELAISDGVTAIIGPNGSGKSNLSDSIRWVLGEQSAKALRGNKMEDVIFNGTAVKRPLSMCSVSLSFDNADRKLQFDSDEVTVTRRAFRSGEGEYAINGRDCRLKDILNLFRDTGIGKDGYSIISQGRVDEILSSRTQDRREALEEAAGVTRFRIRREETIKKLNQAQRNIERLEDILNELTNRLLPLKVESEKAKKSLTLLEDLKTLEINFFLRETEKNNQKIEGWNQILSECSEAQSANREEDEQLKLQIEKNEKELDEKEAEMSSAREDQYAALSSYEKLQSAIQIESERIHSADSDLARLNEELEEIQTNFERNRTLLASANTCSEKDNILFLKKTLAANETSYKAACSILEEAESELEDLKTAVMNNLNRLGQSRSDRSRLETMRETLLKRQTAIQTEIGDCVKRGEELYKESEEGKLLWQKSVEELGLIEADLERIRSDRLDSEKERTESAQELQQIDSKLIAAQSNLKILSDFVKKREGFQNSVRLLMLDAEKDPKLSETIVGLVAEMITVPKEYETAIGTALGASLQYIVAPTGNDAKMIIEHVRRKQYGRVTILPLDILRKFEPDSRLEKYLSRRGVFGVASNLISCDNKATVAIDFLLGRTLIVENINCALSLRKEDGCYLQIVTLEGDMLQSSGIVSGGSKTKKGFDIISREREIAELESFIKHYQIQKKEAADRLEKAENRWKNAGAMLFLKQADENRLHIETERAKDRVDIISRDIEKNSDYLQKLSEEEESNKDSLNSIDEQLSSLNRTECEIRDTDSTAKKEIIEKQKRVQTLRSQRDNALELYTDAQINVASAEKDELVKEREFEKIRAEQGALLKKSASVKSLISNAVQQSEKAEIEWERLSKETDQVSAEIEFVRAKIDSIQNVINDIKEEANKKRARRDELLACNRDILEKQSRTETAIAKVKNQQEQLADSIWQSYEITYENALPLRTGAPITNISEKISSIKNRIKEIGPVNPGTIQEYDEVQKRHSELSEQLSDINKASDDLENLIEKLTKTMEKTFREGFAKIQTEFENVFEELFAGGRAELRLKDTNDVLNSEIEIIAQPPGKKLQLLSLMSGGERALTAIALLFAMLRIKSPSFCVLDEIETSLDEENVNRFASFLTRYGKETQFIVITHRKGSMEAADTIYGVSMEEKGVSSIVSAKWEENA